MALCQECIKRSTCKEICDALNKEITGRGKTASRKPKTYPVDFSYIEDPHQCLNGFQKDVLNTIAELSLANNPLNRFDVEEAITSCLNKNEQQVIKLFMANHKQDEIAKNLGVSQPRVNFLLKRALRKLKKYFLSQL